MISRYIIMSHRHNVPINYGSIVIRGIWCKGAWICVLQFTTLDSEEWCQGRWTRL